MSDNNREWADMTPAEREELLTEWEQAPGTIEHAVSTLTATSEEKEIALRVLREIKELTYKEDWEVNPLQWVLELLEREAKKRIARELTERPEMRRLFELILSQPADRQPLFINTALTAITERTHVEEVTLTA